MKNKIVKEKKKNYMTEIKDATIELIKPIFKKYGATTNPLKRLGLHAHAFGFIHPVTKKKYEFKVDCPKGFYGKK